MRTGRPRMGSVIKCRWCGKDFYQRASFSNRTLCSHKCRDELKLSARLNEVDGTAKCSKCNEWKPVLEFVKGIAGRPHSYCKECNRRYFEERRRRVGQKPITPPEQASKNRKDYKREWNRIDAHARRAAGKKPPVSEVRRMFKEQSGKCVYCGCELPVAYHIDHKTPISRGGMNNIENLHLTCPRCNLRKSTMTHEEFLLSKKRPTRQWA